MSVQDRDSELTEQQQENEESVSGSESESGTNSEPAVSESLLRQSPVTKSSTEKERSRSRQSSSQSSQPAPSRRRSRSPHRSLSSRRRSRQPRRRRSRSRSRGRSRNRSRSRSRSRSSRSQSPSTRSSRSTKKSKKMKPVRQRKPPAPRRKESEYEKKYINWTWILTPNGEIWLFPEHEEVSIGKPDDVFNPKRVFAQHVRREGRDKKDHIPCLVFWNNETPFLIQPDRYYSEHPHAIKELGERLTSPASEVNLNEKKSKFFFSIDTYPYFRIHQQCF